MAALMGRSGGEAGADLITYKKPFKDGAVSDPSWILLSDHRYLVGCSVSESLTYELDLAHP